MTQPPSFFPATKPAKVADTKTPSFAKKASTLSRMQKASDSRARELDAMQTKATVDWDKLTLQSAEIATQRNEQNLMRSQEQTVNLKNMDNLDTEYNEAAQNPFHNLKAFFTDERSTDEMLDDQRILVGKMKRLYTLNASETELANQQLETVATAQANLLRGTQLRSTQMSQASATFAEISGQQQKIWDAADKFMEANITTKAMGKMIESGDYKGLPPAQVQVKYNARQSALVTSAAARKKNQKDPLLAMDRQQLTIAAQVMNLRGVESLPAPQGQRIILQGVLKRIDALNKEQAILEPLQQEINNALVSGASSAYNISNIRSRIDIRLLPTEAQGVLNRAEQVSAIQRQAVLDMTARTDACKLLPKGSPDCKKVTSGEVTALAQVSKEVQDQERSVVKALTPMAEAKHGKLVDESSAASCYVSWMKDATVPLACSTSVLASTASRLSETAAAMGAPEQYRGTFAAFNSEMKAAFEALNPIEIKSGDGKTLETVSALDLLTRNLGSKKVPINEVTRQVLDAKEYMLDSAGKPRTDAQGNVLPKVAKWHGRLLGDYNAKMWKVAMPAFVDYLRAEMGDAVASRVEGAMMQDGQLRPDLKNGKYGSSLVSTDQATLSSIVDLSARLTSEGVLAKDVNLGNELRDFLIGRRKPDTSPAADVQSLLAQDLLTSGDETWSAFANPLYGGLQAGVTSLRDSTIENLMLVPLSGRLAIAEQNILDAKTHGVLDSISALPAAAGEVLGNSAWDALNAIGIKTYNTPE